MARLLGHKSHSALSLYEHGYVLPPLITALQLEIILRTPVAFLFPEIYDRLKESVRSQEEIYPAQQPLFPQN